jgi:hypothetical protein
LLRRQPTTLAGPIEEGNNDRGRLLAVTVAQTVQTDQIIETVEIVQVVKSI